jgi:hypothetical protein
VGANQMLQQAAKFMPANANQGRRFLCEAY